jgi:hypothetical protein
MIGLLLLLQTTRLLIQSAPPIAAAAARVALASIASASMWFVLAQKCKSVPLSLAENFDFSNYSFSLFSCALSLCMDGCPLSRDIPIPILPKAFYPLSEV